MCLASASAGHAYQLNSLLRGVSEAAPALAAAALSSGYQVCVPSHGAVAGGGEGADGDEQQWEYCLVPPTQDMQDTPPQQACNATPAVLSSLVRGDVRVVKRHARHRLGGGGGEGEGAHGSAVDGSEQGSEWVAHTGAPSSSFTVEWLAVRTLIRTLLATMLQVSVCVCVCVCVCQVHTSAYLHVCAPIFMR